MASTGDVPPPGSLARGVGPRVGVLRLGVADQLEDLDLALPDGLALEGLVDGHRLDPGRVDVVEIADRFSESFVFLHATEARVPHAENRRLANLGHYPRVSERRTMPGHAATQGLARISRRCRRLHGNSCCLQACSARRRCLGSSPRGGHAVATAAAVYPAMHARAATAVAAWWSCRPERRRSAPR